MQFLQEGDKKSHEQNARGMALCAASKM